MVKKKLNEINCGFLLLIIFFNFYMFSIYLWEEYRSTAAFVYSPGEEIWRTWAAEGADRKRQGLRSGVFKEPVRSADNSFIINSFNKSE